MKKFIIIFLCLLSMATFQAKATPQFNQLLPIMTAKPDGKIITPKTTAELEKAFDNPLDQMPRIFVKKLPKDFAKVGTPELYAKILTALILRENEQILGERYLFLLLKDKYEKGQKWTQTEQQFFDSLVEKYDAVVLKTIPTKIADLYGKIDEIPPALAILQSAMQTNWGKTNMNSPYGQKGWANREKYDFIPYTDLIQATSAYVREMNATPNYDQWRRLRMSNQDKNQSTFYVLSGLRVYMPEDVDYVEKIKKLLNQNRFLYKYDQALFEKVK